MYNTLAPIANFILQFLDPSSGLLAQPIRAFLVLPLSIFAVIATFRILWNLH